MGVKAAGAAFDDRRLAADGGSRRHAYRSQRPASKIVEARRGRLMPRTTNATRSASARKLLEFPAGDLGATSETLTDLDGLLAQRRRDHARKVIPYELFASFCTAKGRRSCAYDTPSATARRL